MAALAHVCCVPRELSLAYWSVGGSKLVCFMVKYSNQASSLRLVNKFIKPLATSGVCHNLYYFFHNSNFSSGPRLETLLDRGVCWNTRRWQEILWFLHTIQFEFYWAARGKKRKREQKHPLQFGIALTNFKWCLNSRACCSSIRLRRIESSGKNQNILNAHIKFFRFITLDLWNLFRHWLKSCVNLRRDRVKGSKDEKAKRRQSFCGSIGETCQSGYF